jgi:hypothetical protein
LLRSSSKEKAISEEGAVPKGGSVESWPNCAVAPKPALSTHPHSKLLGFLAFSYDSSLFQHSQ